jgi:hypothetical protein
MHDFSGAAIRGDAAKNLFILKFINIGVFM